MRFGIALHESGSARTLEALRRADALDVPVAWLTSGGGEQMTLFAAGGGHDAPNLPGDGHRGPRIPGTR